MDALTNDGSIDAGDLEARAADLVNPASGIANDYLNHFNEVLLLIENLPVMLPEMVDEILGWTPISYREYFEKSRLPGSAKALQIYDSLDADFRAYFEREIEGLNRLALESVSVIKQHRAEDGSIDPDAVSDYCERASATMRKSLEHTADIVNNGRKAVVEAAQSMADRLLVAPAA
jgi:hypothetical protein